MEGVSLHPWYYYLLSREEQFLSRDSSSSADRFSGGTLLVKLDLRIARKDHPLDYRMEEAEIGKAGEPITSIVGNEIADPKTPRRKLTVTLKANRFHKILSCPHLMAPLDGDMF